MPCLRLISTRKVLWTFLYLAMLSLRQPLKLRYWKWIPISILLSPALLPVINRSGWIGNLCMTESRKARLLQWRTISGEEIFHPPSPTIWLCMRIQRIPLKNRPSIISIKANISWRRWNPDWWLSTSIVHISVCFTTVIVNKWREATDSLKDCFFPKCYSCRRQKVLCWSIWQTTCMPWASICPCWAAEVSPLTPSLPEQKDWIQWKWCAALCILP